MGDIYTIYDREMINVFSVRARAHQGNWQLQRNRNFRELLSVRVEHMLLNGAAHTEKTATLHSVTCVQLRLIISEIAVALQLPVSLVCPRPYSRKRPHERTRDRFDNNIVT
jgi:hypothetical protein